MKSTEAKTVPGGSPGKRKEKKNLSDIVPFATTLNFLFVRNCLIQLPNLPLVFCYPTLSIKILSFTLSNALVESRKTVSIPFPCRYFFFLYVVVVR